ncbi:MAG: nucleoside phosphorylase [Syntrophales bacterium]
MVQLPEYAGRNNAIIEPSRIRPKGIRVPRQMVFCFFREIVEELEDAPGVQLIHHIHRELGKHPILVIQRHRRSIGVLHPGIGGPLAASSLEQVIALGARDVVACGGAGVLDSSLSQGTVVLPTAAVRDEGTSYHYQRRSRTNRPHPEVVRALIQSCKAHDIPFVRGKTWTTDAVFRETPKKIQSRRAEGCLTVEMEAAAFFAVAHFRSIRFGQLLYAGDDVGGSEWDHRHWHKCLTARQKIFELAVDAVLRLA